MKIKLFKADKNYILKKVQKESQSSLIKFLISTSINTYQKKTNSIGILDKTSELINNYPKFDKRYSDVYSDNNKITLLTNL